MQVEEFTQLLGHLTEIYARWSGVDTDIEQLRPALHLERVLGLYEPEAYTAALADELGRHPDGLRGRDLEERGRACYTFN